MIVVVIAIALRALAASTVMIASALFRKLAVRRNHETIFLGPAVQRNVIGECGYRGFVICVIGEFVGEGLTVMIGDAVERRGNGQMGFGHHPAGSGYQIGHMDLGQVVLDCDCADTGGLVDHDREDRWVRVPLDGPDIVGYWC